MAKSPAHTRKEDQDIVNSNLEAKDLAQDVLAVIKWQRKGLPSNYITDGASNIADLTFNNLEIGKTYRVSGMIYGVHSDGTGDFNVLSLKQGATVVSVWDISVPGGGAGVSLRNGINAVFTATDTTLIAESNLDTNAYFAANTFLILEEVQYHAETTDFT